MAASSRKCPKEFGCYVRGKLIGSGAFANVYACRKADDEEQIFAAKIIDLHALRLTGKGDRELHKLKREASILNRIRPHENVVQFVDVVEHEDGWYIFILEFVQGGNLLQSVTKRRSEPLKEQEVVSIFRQLVDGLQHLHNEGVIHRDLKLENVLVVQEGSARKDFKVKITDFGLSKEVGDGMSAACSVVGSPKYVAPEVLALGTHDFKADLWSLGILLFVMLGQRFPFNGDHQASRQTQDKLDAELFALPVNELARSVLMGLLRIQVDERLSLEKLSKHEWLSSVPDSTPKAKRRKVHARKSSPSLEGQPEAEADAPGWGPGGSLPPARGNSKEPPDSANSAGSGGPDPCTTSLPAPVDVEISTAPTPVHPKLAPNNRRRSWIDCSPEEAEDSFLEKKEMMRKMTERGFDSTMAEIALQSADWNLDTAIMMLEG